MCVYNVVWCEHAPQGVIQIDGTHNQWEFVSEMRGLNNMSNQLTIAEIAANKLAEQRYCSVNPVDRFKPTNRFACKRTEQNKLSADT